MWRVIFVHGAIRHDPVDFVIQACLALLEESALGMPDPSLILKRGSGQVSVACRLPFIWVWFEHVSSFP